MSVEMDKVYDPKRVEKDIYQLWLDQGCFRAKDSSTKKAYWNPFECCFRLAVGPRFRAQPGIFFDGRYHQEAHAIVGVLGKATEGRVEASAGG